MVGKGARVTGDAEIRIICLTSNGYINCIEPFAYYFNRFSQGDRRTVTVAHYDVAPTNLPDNFEMIAIGKQADYTWSSGLLKLLEMIDDPTLILLLEDYWITAPVDWGKTASLHQEMLYNQNIVKIDLSDDRLKLPYIEIAPGIIQGSWGAPFQTSLQAALWRTEFLRYFLDKNESAWQFEKNGTKRVIDARRAGTFCGAICGLKTPFIQYANMVGGMGTKPGVLEKKHCPDWLWEECVAKGWAHG